MAEKGFKKIKLTSIKAEEDAEWDYLESDEWYLGEFLECTSEDGDFGAYLKLTFKALNGSTESGASAKGNKITRIMNPALSPSSVLGAWAKVFSGKEIKTGSSFDITAYYGNKYRMLIKDKPKKKGSKSDKRFQYIDTIKRRKPVKKKA